MELEILAGVQTCTAAAANAFDDPRAEARRIAKDRAEAIQ
jgi:hypothetical protein